MSDRAPMMLEPASAGLAGLLSALQPRAAVPVPPAPPPPDPDAIRAEAWDAGFAAGEASATAALAPLRQRLAEAAEALEAARQIDADTLRPLLLPLVRAVAEAVLHAELSAGAGVLQPLVTAALAAVRPGEAATLCAAPETLAALQPHLPAIATRADPALGPDQIRVIGNDFVIDAGLAARLAAITGAMA